jgi:hypothetical protein
MSPVNPNRAGWPAAGDDERVVRPYALTAGRTRPSGRSIDLVALVSMVRDRAGSDLAIDDFSGLGPEHISLLRFCRSRASVADLAAAIDLPLGVVRILLADLRERGLVTISQPAAGGLNDVRILKEVADALRRL